MQVSLDEEVVAAKTRQVDVLALDEALASLSEFDPRKGRVVELRYFGGLSVEETAEVLGISPETAKRDWKMAKAWLFAELTGDRKTVPARDGPAGRHSGEATRIVSESVRMSAHTRGSGFARLHVYQKARRASAGHCRKICIPDPQSRAGPFGHWLGADDFLRGRHRCILGIPAGKRICSRESARRVMGRTVFSHARSGPP